jgi:hypothetical protein
MYIARTGTDEAARVAPKRRNLRVHLECRKIEGKITQFYENRISVLLLIDFILSILWRRQ